MILVRVFFLEKKKVDLSWVSRINNYVVLNKRENKTKQKTALDFV